MQEEFKIIETPKSADILIFERLFGTTFLVQVYSRPVLPDKNLVSGIFKNFIGSEKFDLHRCLIGKFSVYSWKGIPVLQQFLFL